MYEFSVYKDSTWETIPSSLTTRWRNGFGRLLAPSIDLNGYPISFSVTKPPSRVNLLGSSVYIDCPSIHIVDHCHMSYRTLWGCVCPWPPCRLGSRKSEMGAPWVQHCRCRHRPPRRGSKLLHHGSTGSSGRGGWRIWCPPHPEKEEERETTTKKSREALSHRQRRPEPTPQEPSKPASAVTDHVDVLY